MTNRNMNSNAEEYLPDKHRQPFLLRPAGKDYLWGGRRLRDDFAKNMDMEPLAETWECSTHPAGLSMAATGIFAGMSLAEVLRRHPEFLGTHPAAENGLPILIKLIDAREDLSVQVHPDDEYARRYEDGQPGKTELWYVMDASKDARIIYGLHQDTEKSILQRAALDGTIGKYLQKVPVKRDDVFYVEPGTIHAIGAGVLIAEVQENSDLTYRLYDYGRVDKHGKMRKLHIDKALDVADLAGSARPRQPVRVLQYRPGIAEELLCRCKYFEVCRMLVNTERRQKVYFRADSISFRVLLCMNGCGVIRWENGSLNIYKGDCVFFPADSVRVSFHGQMQMLCVRG